MERIESYSFGEITLGVQKFTEDVIITPQGIRIWWRGEGHKVSPGDIQEALSQNPEVVIIGTGKYEQVKVPSEMRRFVESQGIRLIAQGTDKACSTYNQLCSCQRVVAALHLTC